MTTLIRTATIGAAAFAVCATVAAAQRTRGTMGAPATTTQPPPPHPTPSGRGTMSTPLGPYSAPQRRGDLPRITDGPRRRDDRSGYGSGRGQTGYSSGGIVSNRGYYIDRRPRYTSRPYTRAGFGGCVYSCVSFSSGIRTGRYFSSFTIGYPFAVPIIVPYFVVATPEVYVERGADDRYADDRYVEEVPRAASKLIVIGGGTGGGGDALTVESIGDSVRLNWLPNGKQAREVKLFVADSAQRQLATRIASPAMPSATFEIATLSSPVAFAGVTVTFADGVMSTTVVPYRGGASGQRR